MTQDSIARPDPGAALQSLLPLTARQVLICDGGALAQHYLPRNPAAHVTGIGRTDPAPGVDVLGGDPAALAKSGLGDDYDLIVLNGTLAAQSKPERFLRRLRDRLRIGGTMVVSNPNPAHWSMIRQQITGQPMPRVTGLAELGALIAGAGLTLRRSRAHRPAITPEMQPWLDGLVALGHAQGLPEAELRGRLTASDYILVAERLADGARPQPRMQLHLIELAKGMDVRTRIPAMALAAEPDISMTISDRQLYIPDTGSRGGVVIAQRPRVSDPQRILNFAAECQRKGVVMVIEYDDDPSLVARTLPREDVPEIYHRNMALAHAVQTSTEVLAQMFRRANPEVHVFPNMAGDVAPPRRHQGHALRVLFAAVNRSRMAETAALFAPAIAALPDLQFDVVHDRVFFDALPTTQKTFHKWMNYRQYLDLMGRCDLALMPLEGLPDELGKSDVKWVEAASRSAIAIASPAVYADTIRDGETGFIIREDGDWSRLLIQLSGDAGLRDRVATAARAEVVASRMMAHQVAARRDWYRSLLARRDELYAGAISRSPALAALLAGG